MLYPKRFEQTKKGYDAHLGDDGLNKIDSPFLHNVGECHSFFLSLWTNSLKEFHLSES